MAFENVFGNVRFDIPVNQANQNASQLSAMIGQGVAMAQRKEEMDMKRRQMEMESQKMPDLSTMAQKELLKMRAGVPYDENVIRAYSDFKGSQTYADPITGRMVTQPDLAQRIGLDNAPMPTQAMRQLPQGNSQLSPELSQMANQYPMQAPAPTPQMPQGFQDIAGDGVYNISDEGMLPPVAGMEGQTLVDPLQYQAGGVLSGTPRGSMMEEQTKQSLSEYAAKKNIDLAMLDKEQKQKLMFEKEAAEMKMEMAKQASMPSKVAESDIMFNDVKKALNIIDKNKESGILPASGTIGQFASLVSETDAGNLKSYLSTIQAATGLGKLSDMRESSPTGASGLGALSEKEMKVLQDIMGEMQISTDTDILQNNLKRYYNTRMDLIHGTPDFIQKQVAEGKVKPSEVKPYMFRYNTSQPNIPTGQQSRIQRYQELMQKAGQNANR